MDDKELYELAKAGHPDCIPGLMQMITFAAIEILRLEGERDKLKARITLTANKQFHEFVKNYTSYSRRSKNS